MKNLLVLISIFFIVGCKTEKPKNTIMDPNKVERNSAKREVKIFFTKDEIVLPSIDSIYTSKENEVIIFRPTEYNFGKLVEETQSEDLLNLDGEFEELTLEIIDTFKGNKKVKISICEKPFIAIDQPNETLYLDTSKDLYGVIFCRKNQKPVFKSATEQNIIKQIKVAYNI